MRIHQEKINITASEPIESKSYSIRAQDMGFLLEVLRKRMYADPIKALCREISCNSRDANTEVGTPDLPVEIVLPNSVNKFIQFKDNGPGISKRRMTFFMNYGASTKRDDNEQVGGFGLGSKTPFAYSDSFSIVTVYGGKKYHYNAVIDETRAGTMNLVDEYDTDEHTGTTIIVPVHDKDIVNFARAVVETTKFWKVRPNVLGLPAAVQYPPEDQPLLVGDGWELYNLKQQYNYYDRADQSLVLIEGVSYPVTPADLGLEHNEENTWMYALLQNQIRMHFSIGKLTIASNRDTLHFDERTRALIIKKLEDVRVALLENAKKKIAEQPDLREAERFWSDFISQLPLAKNTKVLWNGFELQGLMRYKSAGVANSPIDKIEIQVYGRKHARRSNKELIIAQSSSEVSLDKKSEVFLLDDRDVPTNKVAKRIKNYLLSSPNVSKVYLIDWEGDTDTRVRWKEELGFDHIPMPGISSLPDIKANYTKRVRGPNRTVVDAWEFCSNYYGEKDSEKYWKPTTIDKEDGEGVYIVCVDKRGQGYTDGENKIYRNQIEFMHECKLTDDKFYLIREQDIKKLGDDWMTLADWMEENIKPVCESVSSAEVEYYREASQKCQHAGYLDRFQRKPEWMKRFSDDSIFLKFFEQAKSFHKENSAFETRRNIYNRFVDKYPSTVTKTVTEHPIVSIVELLNNKYPLLRMIGDFYDSNIEHVFNYINMVDNQKLPLDSKSNGIHNEDDDTNSYAAAC